MDSLSTSRLTDLERQLFPAFHKLTYRRPYLAVRTAIYDHWAENPQRFLSLKVARRIARRLNYNYDLLVQTAYHFLHRYRYINSGVFAMSPSLELMPVAARRPRIVVIGAGMAGITAARELVNIYAISPAEIRPEIVLLEGRSRIGGRVHSFTLSTTSYDPETTPSIDLGIYI
jgi:hypothetical protein